MLDHVLKSYLDHISKSVLLSIVRELTPIIGALPEYGDDEVELRNELVKVLLDPSHIQLLYKNLSSYEQHVLEFFIFQVGKDFLTFRQIEQGYKGIKPNFFRLGLVALRRKGIIFTLRRQWGEEAYVLPTDLEEAFYKHILAEEGTFDDSFSSLSAVPVSESPDLEQKQCPPAYQWMFFILDDLRQMKDGTVPLTQKGTIHKRHIRLWEEAWCQEELSLQAFDLTIEHKDIYSSKLAVILDYFSSRHLITWEYQAIHIQDKLIDQFMQQSRTELHQDFIQYWHQHYKPKTDWMQSYYRDALGLHTTHDWIPVLQFVERWEDRYELPPINELIRKLKEELLDPLYLLGLIEYGTSEANEWFWRWLSVEEGVAEVWVQPNLECFCSALTPISTLWKLTRVFALDSWDHMLVLRLSEQKLIHAVDKGISVPQWLEWLETAAKLPVPDEFKQQLLDWQAKAHQVTMADVILLKVNDAQLLQAIVQFCKQHELELSLVTDSYIAIQKGREEAIQLFLEQNRISVHVIRDRVDDTEDNGRDRQTSSNQQTPIAFNNYYLADQLRIESVFPDLTEAIPSWNKIPDIWKKQMVAYHEQTKREILEKAIQYQLHIKYESTEGECLIIKPVVSQPIAGEWVCMTEDKGKIPLYKMKRMQLLFPVPIET